MLRNAALASSVVASMPIVVPLHQPRVRQPLQHPGEHRAMRLQIDQPARARDRRVVRGRFLQLQLQETPHAQRIGRAPRNRPFRVEALKIAEQQQAKVPTRRETGPSHDLGVERGARTFDERIELRLVEHPIQPSVERVRRTARQILRGHPHRRLARSSFAFAHRHAQSLGHGIDAVDPYSLTCATGC